MKIVTAIEQRWTGVDAVDLSFNVRIRVRGVWTDGLPSGYCHVHLSIQSITLRPHML
jgi:hypothetical protein